MNNKGFTLVELLAVIVIIAVLGSIATYGVINAIKVSKDKAEDAFLNELGKTIETYISFNTPSKKNIDGINFTKKIISTGGLTNSYYVSSSSTAWEMNGMKLQDLLEYSDNNKFVNPKNSDKECNLENEVTVFMDSDYVYYYYVDFDEMDCVSDGKIVNTLPKELICKIDYLKDNYDDASNVLEKCTE